MELKMNKFPICPIFIPANKLTYVEKAIKSGADGIIFDLEDSILLNDKPKARENLFKYLSSNNPDAIIYIRINDLSSENGISDLEMLSELNFAFIIPKFEDEGNFNKISKDIKIIPLIETPLAINNLHKIAKNEKVIGLSFGAADFSSMIGSEMSWDAMLYARSKIILECSINNLISIDSPFMNIANMDAFENEVKKSKSIGMQSKAAINPSQISIIKKYFLPTKDEILEAKEIINLYKKSNNGVFSYKGKVIDKPIIKIMENKLIISGNN
tara:strand:+ start:384 stop:1196 length:813 start_codon:yes stop_codon:yes gene_type:complete